jgi:hypothetical protein
MQSCHQLTFNSVPGLLFSQHGLGNPPVLNMKHNQSSVLLKTTHFIRWSDDIISVKIGDSVINNPNQGYHMINFTVSYAETRYMPYKPEEVFHQIEKLEKQNSELNTKLSENADSIKEYTLKKSPLSDIFNASLFASQMFIWIALLVLVVTLIRCKINSPPEHLYN